MTPNVQTFIGCEASYEDASCVIFGAPFDSTTSFRPGARFAGSAMRTESVGLETWSPYQRRDLTDKRIFDAGELDLPFGNAASALAEIERFTATLLRDGKKPCMIGGEHLTTLGAVRAVSAVYGSDLYLLHFDAHADLRQEYMGEELSHATVIRRVWDILGDGRIYQFGIRSGCREELAWCEGRVTTEMFYCKTMQDVIARTAGAPVYITVDLDVLDPSVFPGTGTPEPGGVSFKDLLSALLQARDLNVVAFDVCELSPHYDASGASTAVACKILREMLLAWSE